MVDVHLHGRLAAEIGPRFRLAVRSVPEALRALECNFPGRVYSVVAEGDWRIIRGPLDGGEAVAPEGLAMELGAVREAHLVPVLAGSKQAGMGQIIVGALLVAAAVTATVVSAGTLTPAAMAGTSMLWGATTASSVAFLGLVTAFGGAVQLLSPAPKTDYSAQERPEDRQSHIYQGPVNAQTQGGPVPLVFGRLVRVGSVIVAGSITPEAML